MKRIPHIYFYEIQELNENGEENDIDKSEVK